MDQYQHFLRLVGTRDPALKTPVFLCGNLCWCTIVQALERSSEALPDWHPRKHLGALKVQAAAVWVTIAGRELRQLVKDRPIT